MKQRGFSMLEVLVAMLVVSIGLLGLAGLTAASIRNNQSAYQRSIASWLAYDILDRMRANRNVAQAGTYVINLGAAPGGGQASTDLTEWKQELAASLPTGDGSVQPIAGGGFEDHRRME